MIKKKKKEKKGVSAKPESYIQKLPNGTVVDKRLYAELSKSNPNNVIIIWGSMSDTPVFLFVVSDQKEEKLFASGKKGVSEVAWIQNGKSYEFNLYHDSDRKNPIVRLSLVKSATELKQSAFNLH